MRLKEVSKTGPASTINLPCYENVLPKATNSLLEPEVDLGFQLQSSVLQVRGLRKRFRLVS